jgi:hypothetical protein
MTRVKQYYSVPSGMVASLSVDIGPFDDPMLVGPSVGSGLTLVFCRSTDPWPSGPNAAGSPIPRK